MKTEKVVIIEEKELRGEQDRLAYEVNKITEKINSSTRMTGADLQHMRREKYNLQGKMEFIDELLGDNEVVANDASAVLIE